MYIWACDLINEGIKTLLNSYSQVVPFPRSQQDLEVLVFHEDPFHPVNNQQIQTASKASVMI